MTIKTYLDNPYLKEIKANIVEKKAKDDKYFLILDRTIFYPHLVGGQPRDHGTIEGKEVINVYEEGNDIIHVLKEDVSTSKVDLAIDWNRRFDLMQQHTGQHLLSANIYNLYNAETISTHFTEDYLSLEIDKPSLNEKEVKQIEYLTNKVIQSNFKITSYIPDSQDLLNFPLKKDIKSDDPIRIVEIDGLDYEACVGTHLASTGEIGILKICNWRKVGNHIKINFVAGNRAISDYGDKNKYINQLKDKLNVPDEDILDKVDEVIESQEALKDEIEDLKNKLAETKGRLYLSKSNSYDGINYVVNDFDSISLKDLGKISSYLNEEDNVIQMYNIKNTSDKELSQFVLSRSFNLGIDLRDVYDDISDGLDVRGGGNRHTIQGAASPSVVDLIIRSFYSSMRDLYKDNEAKED